MLIFENAGVFSLYVEIFISIHELLEKLFAKNHKTLKALILPIFSFLQTSRKIVTLKLWQIAFFVIIWISGVLLGGVLFYFPSLFIVICSFALFLAVKYFVALGINKRILPFIFLTNQESGLSRSLQFN